MPYPDWMAPYADRKLGKMHLPGAHDAGTAKNYIDKTAFGSDSNAATQSLTIAEQLQAGTRFFDLRLAKHNKRVVAHHTTGGQGAYSTRSVDQVIAAAAEFCYNHRNEVAVFRISHTSLTTNAHELAMDSAIYNGKRMLHIGTGNLCDKKLKDITKAGGGLVCIFEHSKFATVIDQRNGIHSFQKYKENPANDQGISCCGVYSGTHKLNQVMTNSLKGQYEHNEKHTSRNKHLWQVYWQKTYVNPASTTGIQDGTEKDARYKNGKIHGGTHAALGYMIGVMKGLGGHGTEDYEVVEEESHKEGHLWNKHKVIDKQRVMYSTLDVRNYSMPNIISYDFVNEEQNKEIIDLNDKTLQWVWDD